MYVGKVGRYICIYVRMNIYVCICSAKSGQFPRYGHTCPYLGESYIKTSVVKNI